MDHSIVIEMSNEQSQQHSDSQITKTYSIPSHQIDDHLQPNDPTDSTLAVDQYPTETTVKTVNLDGETVKSSSSSPSVDSGEKVCRICLLSDGGGNNGDDDLSMRLIELGCACKDELGISHYRCAHAWFSLKKSRTCEICGKPAKNIQGIEDMAWRITRLQPMEVRSNIPIQNNTTPPVEGQRSQLCVKSSCNFLLTCLILAFFLPWFVHVLKPW